MEIDTVKLNITDKCGARCATCLQHQVTPQKTMTPDYLRTVLLQVGSICRHLFINGTGDYLSLPNHQEYSDVIAEYFQAGKLPETSITTNAGYYDRPRIWASMIVCSLNAVTEETFDRHIGIEGGLHRVVANIKQLAADHGAVQVHSLKWEGNPDPDEALLQLFDGVPVSIRVSEKVENQCQSLVTGDRVPCEYLQGLTVQPDGSIRRCSHDFFASSLFGHIDDIETAIEKRDQIMEQHRQGIFPGICENCNFNIAEHGGIYWIK